MVAVWVLAGLFVAWLALAVYRVWVQVRAAWNAAAPWDCPGGMKQIRVSKSQRVAILLQDRAGQVEWFVRRVAAGLEGQPGLQLVLVDGGSADGTDLVLERLARHFNLGFRRLAELNYPCRRAGGDMAVEREIRCRLEKCFETEHQLSYVNLPNLPVLCLDLRGVPANELLMYNLV